MRPRYRALGLSRAHFSGGSRRALLGFTAVFVIEVLADKARDQRRLLETMTRAIGIQPLGFIGRKQDVDARQLRHSRIFHRAQAR